MVFTIRFLCYTHPAIALRRALKDWQQSLKRSEEEYNLLDKAIVITGGTSGIGLQAARVLSQRGTGTLYPRREV